MTYGTEGYWFESSGVYSPRKTLHDRFLGDFPRWQVNGAAPFSTSEIKDRGQ
jgi:hypothetical protein